MRADFQKRKLKIINAKIYIKDWIKAFESLPDCHVQMAVTSPPYYGLRSYEAEGESGAEETPEQYIHFLVDGFSKFKRVLKDDGLLFVNIGDAHYNYRPGKYLDGRRNTLQTNSAHNRALPANSPKRKNKLEGYKEKDLMMLPAQFAIEMRKSGWYLRSEIIWYKKNPYPESVIDRPTRAHEFIYMFSKSKKYYCDLNSVKEPTVEGTGLRRMHDVWSILPSKFRGHFATFPEEIPRRCIKMGSKEGDTVYDMFSGAGTTGKVAMELSRNYLASELSLNNAELSKKRILESYPDTLIELI